MAAIDEAKLHEFVGRMLGDLGGATSVALVRIGDALGLYRALRDGGPATSAEFAARIDHVRRRRHREGRHRLASRAIRGRLARHL